MTTESKLCTNCGTALDRPGDFCLTCRTANTDAVVVSVDEERTTLTMTRDGSVIGETAVTTTVEPDRSLANTAWRNYAGRVVDEIRRKRPEAVYLNGGQTLARTVQSRLHFPCFRIEGDDPVEAALAARRGRELEVDDRPPAEKIGGRHTTLIGDRVGRRAVLVVAGHQHVKKLVPGPIESGGASGQTGVRSKVTRADANGNLRLLIRSGSSIQENRIITTAMNKEYGERLAEELNDRLAAEGLD